jgi:4-hydroxybenzoate polyprenyltransferase
MVIGNSLPAMMSHQLELAMVKRNMKMVLIRRRLIFPATAALPRFCSLLKRGYSSSALLQSNRLPAENNSVKTITSVKGSESWIDRNLWIPKSARPYMHLARVDKQIGTLLLLWPCIWSTALAAPAGCLPDFMVMGQFAVGAFIMRGAGCTINDLWDQKYDRNVERTKNRPLACGDLNTKQALIFLSAQLSCGLALLVSFDLNCIVLGLASMPLVVAYPLMKRFSNWPQLVLGLAFNWGALMGWPAVHSGVFGLEHSLPLYASGVCWTLVYDTIYGYQDRKDYAKLGLKSTSLHLGDNPQVALTAIASGMIGGLALTGYSTGLTLPFYVGVGAVGGHLMWQIWTADLNDSENLWSRFSSNKYTGAAVTAAIMLGHF